MKFLYSIFQKNKTNNVETNIGNDILPSLKFQESFDELPNQRPRSNSRKLSFMRKSKNLLQLENDELKKRLNVAEEKYDRLKKYYFEIKLKETITKLDEFMLRDFNEHYGTTFKNMAEVLSNESNHEALYQKFSKKQILMLKYLKRKAITSLQLPHVVKFDMSISMSVKPFSTMNSSDLETVKQLFDLLEKYNQNNHAFIY
ncbi:hypothetical protein DDB_G0280839 [Dictyostelium discoideum AX4]|uniref:Uncharacterized protein n=1 Tax=Dictyostelium discoideum TaxID=44689 RepID=Q54UT4_DICDI|nr:hypothetical protein DDB_G0280839 [Dictyostelium discoideum AX4]EAL67031.1 hypothetical protein DDB_G0280839 [Dictyostelium discoideum AX4]|eukprot:XP_641007.1 hypothetical protein DDB_G0280839 [Dictyostelium discoideum AX4]